MAALALDDRQVRRGPPGHRRLASASSSPTRANAGSGLTQDRATLKSFSRMPTHNSSSNYAQLSQANSETDIPIEAKAQALCTSDADISGVRQAMPFTSLTTSEHGESGNNSAYDSSGNREVLSTATSLGDSNRLPTCSGPQTSPDKTDQSGGVSTFLAQGYAHRKQVCVSDFVLQMVHDNNNLITLCVAGQPSNSDPLIYTSARYRPWKLQGAV